MPALFDSPVALQVWQGAARNGRFLARVVEVLDGRTLRVEIDTGFTRGMATVVVAVVPPGVEMDDFPDDPGVREQFEYVFPPGTAVAITPYAHPVWSAEHGDPILVEVSSVNPWLLDPAFDPATSVPDADVVGWVGKTQAAKFLYLNLRTRGAFAVWYEKKAAEKKAAEDATTKVTTQDVIPFPIEYRAMNTNTEECAGARKTPEFDPGEVVRRREDGKEYDVVGRDGFMVVLRDRDGAEAEVDVDDVRMFPQYDLVKPAPKGRTP